MDERAIEESSAGLAKIFGMKKMESIDELVAFPIQELKKFSNQSARLSICSIVSKPRY